MKTAATSAIVLAMLCSLPGVLKGNASSTNAAKLAAGRVPGFPGQTARVPLSLIHTSVVSGLQFDLGYVNGDLMPGELQLPPSQNNMVLRFREVGLGVYRVLAYSKTGIALATNTSLGHLPFTLPSGDLGASASVDFTNAHASTRQAAAVDPLRLVAGGVSVAQVFVEDEGAADFYLKVLPNRTYVIQATTNFVNWVNLETNYTTLNTIIGRDALAGEYSQRFYRAAAMTPLPFDRTLLLNVVSNRNYVLQASTNLVNWVDLSTNFVTKNVMVVNDPQWLFYPMRFYRAAQANATEGNGSTIGNVEFRPGNQIVFGYNSTPGRSYVMQSSTNLTTWSNVSTNVAGDTLLNFTNLMTPGVAKQLFRIMELP